MMYLEGIVLLLLALIFVVFALTATDYLPDTTGNERLRVTNLAKGHSDVDAGFRPSVMAGITVVLQVLHTEGR
jgi:hypothetical protein